MAGIIININFESLGMAPIDPTTFATKIMQFKYMKYD